MRKIAILNFKGGTGKTTTAVNLSCTLSFKDYKVLIIPIGLERLIKKVELILRVILSFKFLTDPNYFF